MSTQIKKSLAKRKREDVSDSVQQPNAASSLKSKLAQQLKSKKKQKTEKLPSEENHAEEEDHEAPEPVSTKNVEKQTPKKKEIAADTPKSAKEVQKTEQMSDEDETEENREVETTVVEEEQGEEEEEQDLQGEAVVETAATTATPISSALLDSEIVDDGFLSEKRFELMGLSEETLMAVRELGFDRMTHVQAMCLKPLLKGKDVLAQAKTGSGKTLAFTLPCIELLSKAGFDRSYGTGAIITAPTRELAMQLHQVVKKAAKHHKNLSVELVCSGQDFDKEAARLKKGANIVVATPGRLYDHFKRTPQFKYDNLLCLVFDEADRMLDTGFELQLHQILAMVPADRQTMMFSATLTSKLGELARLSLHPSAIFIDADKDSDTITAENLEQYYMKVKVEKKLAVLLKVLGKPHPKEKEATTTTTTSEKAHPAEQKEEAEEGGDDEKSAVKGVKIEEVIPKEGCSNLKVIVFFMTVCSVEFHAHVLRELGYSISLFHGQQTTEERTKSLKTFREAESGLLLATDVIARGLDIPDIDLIIQFDPPSKLKEYIHRVGRTARAGRKGKAIMFLLPSEIEFLQYLGLASVPISKVEKPQLTKNLLTKAQKMVEKDESLKTLAMTAYDSFMRFYNSLIFCPAFNILALDKKKVAASFGLPKAPRIKEVHEAKGTASAAGASKKAIWTEGNTFGR